MPLKLCCCFYCFKKKRKEKTKKIKIELTVDCTEPEEEVNATFLNVLGNLPKTYKLDKRNIDGAYTNPAARGRFWGD